MSSLSGEKIDDKVLVLVLVFLVATVCGGFFFLNSENRQKQNVAIESLKVNRSQLIADFYGTDENARIAAAKTLVYDETFWPELIKAFEVNGSPALAAAVFGHDGNVNDAALIWAENHGYKIMKYSRGVDVSYSVVPDITP